MHVMLPRVRSHPAVDGPVGRAADADADGAAPAGPIGRLRGALCRVHAGGPAPGVRAQAGRSSATSTPLLFITQGEGAVRTQMCIRIEAAIEKKSNGNTS